MTKHKPSQFIEGNPMPSPDEMTMAIAESIKSELGTNNRHGRTKMTQKVTHKTMAGFPQIVIYDPEHSISWKVLEDGYSLLEMVAYKSGDIGLTCLEAGDKHSKQTMISLSRDSAIALRDWLVENLNDQ